VTITIPILANDSAANGALDPASVTLGTLPKLGNVTRNADGSLTYNPRLQTGTDTFTYTVRDSFGVVSNAGKVTVTVLDAPDVLTVTLASYKAAARTWRIDGTSSRFGPGINNSVKIHNGSTVAAPVIGTAPIDALGSFSWVPLKGAAPAPDATQLVTIESTGGGVVTASVSVR
jgi:hypothetical protein